MANETAQSVLDIALSKLDEFAMPTSRGDEGRKEMFYLTTHSTHFIYSGVRHMVKVRPNPVK